MDTYQFCAHWVREHAKPDSRVLDYGCGRGEIVSLLRQSGIDAYGCDAYYGGGGEEWKVSVIDADLRPYILPMAGDHIPHPDRSFDVVISNQVMEHVPNLGTASAEIARVLKPGGVSLNLFPDRSVWREGHSNVPFLHWFPKGNTRLYYTAIMRRLGLTTPNAVTGMVYARGHCKWMDEWCYWRDIKEIHATFKEHFASIEHVEHLWFAARFNGATAPRWLARFIVRKFAGMAVVLRKSEITAGSS